MKTNLILKNGLAHRLLMLKFAMLLLATFAFAGCQTDQFNDTSKQSVSAQAHTEKIVLREGDVLKISFPSSANLDTTQQIRMDGKISLPLVGEVDAAGMSLDDLHDNLVKLYAPQISSKELNVELESSSFPVFVTGCVIRPGKVLSDHPITALEAVMEAGGFDYDKANLRDVKVIRLENGASKTYILNLKVLLEGGKADKPFYLKPSDIIYVPERFNWF